MDFYSKLKFQQNVLTCHNHVNYIWEKIHEETEDIENDEDSEHFYNHIPVQFSRFLAECNHLLLNSGTTELHMEEPDKKYLVALILAGLQDKDVPMECQSIPSQSAILFLSAASMDDGSLFDLVTLEYLIYQLLHSFRRKISYCFQISSSMFLCLNKFLQETPQNIHQFMNRLLYFLRDAIKDSLTVIDNFDLDDDANKLPNKAIFICFRTILEKKYYSPIQLKQVVSRVSVILTHYANCNVTARDTIKYFFKLVLHKHLKHAWYIKLLTLLTEQMSSDDEFFVHVINEISSIDHYYSVVRSILNCFVKSPNKSIDTYLATLYCIVKIPHRNAPHEIREAVIKKIMKQIFLKSADKDMGVKEKITNVFIQLFSLRDIHIRRFLQQMFRDDVTNRISAKVLFGILESDVDVKWKHTHYNTNFIVLTCEMFVSNRDFISTYRLKVIEILCSKTTAFCLKPCVPSIVNVIKRYAIENNPVIRPMLRILTDNALKPTVAANYFINEIFALISDVMTSTVDCDLGIAVCNVLLTDDFDFVSVLKTFETHNLITNRHLQVLFEEKSLKRKPIIWQLLSLLLDLNYFTPFPHFIQYLILNCASVDFYVKPESLYVVQVISKVFAKEVKRSSLDNDGRTFALTVEKIFRTHVNLRQVPIVHVNDVIILLLTLKEITRSDTEWMKRLFYESLDSVLDDIYSQTKAFFVQRNLAYASKIFTLDNFKIEDAYMTRLQEVIALNNRQDMNVADGLSWSLFIVFYGRICLKYPEMISPSISYFQQAILSGTAHVQQIALFALYDVCSMRLNYYEPFEPVIMSLVQSETIEVKSTAIRLLVRLINDDHIRLNCSDFIVFMLVLVDRQLKLCLYYKDILEKDFLLRNENLISKYFIHLMLFLNNYKKHPMFPVLDIKMSTEEYTYERRSIVLKLLFGTLQRYNQFQILSLLSTEVLHPIYTGKMAPVHNVLNIFRDILNIVLVAAMQYITEDIIINETFHMKMFASIKKDFFCRKHHAKMAELEFNNIVEQLMTNLLDILYKIERFNKDLLPFLFNVISIATKAYYDRLLNIVHNTARLRDLYYELPNFYDNYKEMIMAEPVNVLTWERQEWQLYLEHID